MVEWFLRTLGKKIELGIWVPIRTDDMIDMYTSLDVMIRPCQSNYTCDYVPPHIQSRLDISTKMLGLPLR